MTDGKQKQRRQPAQDQKVSSAKRKDATVRVKGVDMKTRTGVK